LVEAKSVATKESPPAPHPRLPEGTELHVPPDGVAWQLE